jgi:hypothetical protein
MRLNFLHPRTTIDGESSQTSKSLLCKNNLLTLLDHKLILTTFPPEIHLQIFGQLSNDKDPITSACLGLTCKAFYKFHKENYPLPIPLQYFTEKHHHLRGQVQLFQLLRSSIHVRYHLELLNDPWTGPMRWKFMTEEARKRYKGYLKAIELMEALHNY